MFQKVTVIFGLLVIGLLSCHRIRHKGDEALKWTRQALAEKKANARDKIIPHFDAFQPDTKFNKKRFEEFFHFYPSPDVKDLYCFGDMIGIDQDFQFAFNCDRATVNKIVSNLGLIKQSFPDESSSGLWHCFPWWDSARIVILAPYKMKGEHELYRYLWYDSSRGKAYYFDFDM